MDNEHELVDFYQLFSVMNIMIKLVVVVVVLFG